MTGIIDRFASRNAVTSSLEVSGSLVALAVFKTDVAEHLGQAGSIPVRLRQMRTGRERQQRTWTRAASGCPALSHQIGVDHAMHGLRHGLDGGVRYLGQQDHSLHGGNDQVR